MAISFLKNLLGVKADQTVRGAMEMYVKWDPKGASEAELRTMEGKLDEMGMHVAQARAKYTEAQKALEAINALMHQRMTAADSLQKQVEAAGDPAQKAALEKSLGTLLDLLSQRLSVTGRLPALAGLQPFDLFAQPLGALHLAFSRVLIRGLLLRHVCS